MEFLTEKARLSCAHGGGVEIQAHQELVKIDGDRVLVEPYSLGVGISGCPNVGVGIKPCTNTVTVTESVSYSRFIRIEGKRVCLVGTSGLTNGTPPGTVKYNVLSPGQSYVGER